LSGNFNELADVLNRSAEGERDGLRRTVERILKTAHVIPLDSDVFDQARRIEAARGMSAPDAIVLASIISHLINAKPTESCFLNRNTNDFDNPNVRKMLDGHGCKFFGRFDEGLRYIETRLAKGRRSSVTTRGFQVAVRAAKVTESESHSPSC
jgi:hypothetical protein